MTTQVHVHSGRPRVPEQRTLARRLMWPSMLGRLFRVHGPRNSTVMHAPVAAVAYSVAVFTWVVFAAPTVALLLLMCSWTVLAGWGVWLATRWMCVAAARGTLWAWHRARELVTAYITDR